MKEKDQALWEGKATPTEVYDGTGKKIIFFFKKYLLKYNKKILSKFI